MSPCLVPAEVVNIGGTLENEWIIRSGTHDVMLTQQAAWHVGKKTRSLYTSNSIKLITVSKKKWSH